MDKDNKKTPELIPLSEWAKQHGISRDGARQKAVRGALPAFKLGRIWVIDKDAENIDHRSGGLSKRWKKSEDTDAKET